MKSIYEMMQEINFEKEAENLEKEFYSLKDEVGISKFNREQLLFYILQKFYSKFNEPKKVYHICRNEFQIIEMFFDIEKAKKRFLEIKNFNPSDKFSLQEYEVEGGYVGKIL